MKEKLISAITNEYSRKKLQYICIYLFFSAVSAGMTALNLITGKGAVTVATALFSVLCLTNYFLVVRGGKRVVELATWLFMVEFLVLDTFFVVSGNPDGFSVIWVAMLPYCSMLLFGRKHASILCGIMLGVMIFFFWTQTGRSILLYEYSETFMLRFPILYTSFFLLSVLMETIREITQRELDRLRETYKNQSVHDYLTKLLNRAGLEELRTKIGTTEDQAVLMIDIDHFKEVNDHFGHEAGDQVLAAVAEEIKRVSGTDVCRWGGEEFVVWFPDSREMCDPECIRKGVEQLDIRLQNGNEPLKVTVSIGAAKGRGDFDALIQRADQCMYQAKLSGRNQVVNQLGA